MRGSRLSAIPGVPRTWDADSRRGERILAKGFRSYRTKKTKEIGGNSSCFREHPRLTVVGFSDPRREPESRGKRRNPRCSTPRASPDSGAGPLRREPATQFRDLRPEVPRQRELLATARDQREVTR